MSVRSRYQAGDQSMLRQMNLSAIMNHIRVDSPISRTLLADTTGLNKATVTNLVNELIDARLIREIGLENGALGRPSMLLSINPQAGYIVSAEIGVNFLTVIAVDFALNEITRIDEELDQDTSVDQVWNLLRLSILKVIDACRQGEYGSLFGVALGVPGLVDYQTGTLLFAPNLGWRDIPLKNKLQEFIEVPVLVDNEANLAALGEFYFGAGYQHNDVLYLSAGVGLGGGIIRDGHLFRGEGGMAGEFGHITMDPEGELCGCGNRGCWETQVSLKALNRLVARSLQESVDSILLQQINGDSSKLDISLIVRAAKNGDRLAADSLNAIGRTLGIGIASCINSLNPGVVVFGGYMSQAWEFLEPAILKELDSRALYWSRKNTRVVLARHGKNACVMGGAAAVHQAVLANPLAAVNTTVQQLLD